MPLRDLAFAGRTLRKSPIFALTAALTIALGVGASTAIFSVTNAVLLRALPYKDPDRLVIAASDLRKRNVRDFPFSNEDFIDMREGTKDAFQDLAGVFTFRNILLKDDGTPEQVRSAVVTTNFFRLVGAKIVLGRDFTDADGMPQPPAPPGAQPGVPTAPPLPIMAILSYEYFQRRYGLNPSVIGQAMITNGPFRPQIAGVLAPAFQLYFPSSANVEPVPEVWLANRLGYDNANRNGVSIHAVGRLRDGVSLERAQAAADNVAAEARKNFLIERTAGYAIRVALMRQHLVSEVRPAILALMGAVDFLLLMPCPHLVDLLLVMAVLRARRNHLRAGLGLARFAAERHECASRNQPKRRSRQRRPLTQACRHRGSSPLLRTAYRIRIDAAQFPRTSAHRSRLRPTRPSNLSSSWQSRRNEAGGTCCVHAPNSGPFARHHWRAGCCRLVSFSAGRGLQSYPLGYRGSAVRRQQISGRGLSNRASGLL